jgi:hypothetical protein
MFAVGDYTVKFISGSEEIKKLLERGDGLG